MIADWPGGDPNNVYMFGAHLDGVAAGPGINDNASGSATLLELALTLAAQNPTMLNHVRFGFWTDEEQGLNGSEFYANTLPSAERTPITGYFNFDMVASTNGGYFINRITSPRRADAQGVLRRDRRADRGERRGRGPLRRRLVQRDRRPDLRRGRRRQREQDLGPGDQVGRHAAGDYDPCYHRVLRHVPEQRQRHASSTAPVTRPRTRCGRSPSAPAPRRRPSTRDTFETATGWTTNPNGTDTATTGAWERGDPAGTTSSGVTMQLGTTVSAASTTWSPAAGRHRARATSTSTAA